MTTDERSATFDATTREWLDTAEDALIEFAKILNSIEYDGPADLIFRLAALADGRFRSDDVVEAYRAIAEIKARWDSDSATEVTP